MQIPVRALAALAFAAMGGGCATYVAPTYSTDYESVDRLKGASLGKVAVGAFQPTNPDAPVNRPRLRGAHFASPDGSFVRYIEAALNRDLSEAGLVAADAATRIEGTLLVNDIDVAGIVTGQGRLDVEISVARAGQQRLRKTYRARTSFDSALMGTIAIQQAQAAYPVLVRTLLKQLYADPEFLNAIRN